MQRVRKDDLVKVVTGKSASHVGRVLRVDRDRDRVLVEGANLVTKHLRVTQGPTGQEGGIIRTEAPIHVSNVMPVCPGCDEPTRVGFELADPADRRSKTRVCRRCGAQF